MTDISARLQSIPGAKPLIQKNDGLWMSAADLDVLELASIMKELGARFSTMTGEVLNDTETVVIYHFYLDGKAYNIKVATKENKLPSISLILPAAEWIEREISDLYKTEFVGHPHPDRLIRPVQLAAGLMREPGGAAGKATR
jgi:NADH:ubiquinone oxidoreductase subunit C